MSTCGGEKPCRWWVQDTVNIIQGECRGNKPYIGKNGMRAFPVTMQSDFCRGWYPAHGTNRDTAKPPVAKPEEII